MTKPSLAEGRRLYDAAKAAFPGGPGVEGITDAWRSAMDEWMKLAEGWESWRNQNAHALLAEVEAARTVDAARVALCGASQQHADGDETGTGLALRRDEFDAEMARLAAIRERMGE
jgi:hypothetical protein